MIRHPTRTAELGLDSLTDTMTNMMGLLLLMVAIAAVRSGGMKITLHQQLEDPGNRTPIYLVCKGRRVVFMHRGDEWQHHLEQVCKDLESQFKSPPTTSEALHEANLLAVQQSPDMHSHFVRETARDGGQEVYLIGIRFYPDEEAGGPASDSDERKCPVTFSLGALDALATADPSREYIDVFVYEGEFDTLRLLQQEAAKRGLKLGWRVLHKDQTPGLSETGESGEVGGEQ